MNITIITSAGGDWEALYKDQQLLDQGHSLNLRAILTKMGHSVHVDEIPESIAEWLDFTAPLKEVQAAIDEYQKSDAILSVEELQQERQ